MKIEQNRRLTVDEYDALRGLIGKRVNPENADKWAALGVDVDDDGWIVTVPGPAEVKIVTQR